LLKATEEVDSVLRDPPPKVQFLKFGDWSLISLAGWTKLPRLHAQIRSDINYRIERLFREAGIEIPFPQTGIAHARGLSADRFTGRPARRRRDVRSMNRVAIELVGSAGAPPALSAKRE
jgi:small-conductance mechanosensitive channel